VVAGALILLPTLTFWLTVFLYWTAGIGSGLMRDLAELEGRPAGTVAIVTLVIGLPFVALPLAVLGRWLAGVRLEKGIRLGNAVLILSVGLLVLGLALPLIIA
jgi:hypothetical protein